MKNTYINIFFAFIVLLFGGCDKENTIKTACLGYEWINLYSNDNGIHYFGEISESETVFKIYSNQPLTRVGINDVICIDINGNPEHEGYWGIITVSQSNNNYLYQIHINSNNSNKERRFLFKFGYGDTLCIINIRQQFCSSESSISEIH